MDKAWDQENSKKNINKELSSVLGNGLEYIQLIKIVQKGQ